MPVKRIFLVLLRFLLLYTAEISGNDNLVNIFHINDLSNEIAEIGLQMAFKELRTEKLLGEVYSVKINRLEGKESFNNISAKWSDAMSREVSKRPHVVLDTTTYGPGAVAVNYFTALKGLPTLSTQYGQENDLRGWRNLSPDQKNYLIQVMSPSDLLPQAIRMLCLQKPITNVAILFDEQFVMYHKYKSLMLNLPSRYLITPIKLPETQLANQIVALRHEGVVNFIILGSIPNIELSIKIALRLNYIGRQYGWYGLTLSHDIPIKWISSSIPFIFLRPENLFYKPHKFVHLRTEFGLPPISKAFFYDMARLSVVAVKSGLDNESNLKKTNYFNSTNAPIEKRQYNFLKLLKEARAALALNYAWGTKNGQHHAKFVVSVGSIINYYSRQLLATWQASVNDPINVGISPFAFHTAVLTYRIVTISKPPFMARNQIDQWEGLCMDLLHEIRSKIPFEFEIYEVPDEQYGTLAVDGKWNGMMRELIDKRADIALGAISLMDERESVVDFTIPYYDMVGISIVMRRPKIDTPLFNFSMVMRGEVWLLILFLYFAVCGFIWIFDRYSPYSYYNNQFKYRNCSERRRFNMKECLWFSMTSLTSQGGGEVPKSLSCQMVVASWWLFGFVFVTSYTANLIAFLTSARLEVPIQSLTDLANQYKIQFAPILNSTEYYYFQRMAYIETLLYEKWKRLSINNHNKRYQSIPWEYPLSDMYAKMFKQMQDTGFPKNFNEALARLRGEIEGNFNEFAFIVDAMDAKYLTLTNCDFYRVGEDFSQKPYALAVQKGSPLKELINQALISIKRDNKLEALKDLWFNQNSRRQRCSDYDEDNSGINVKSIGGVFIVIVIGICVSYAILVLEYFYYNCCQRPIEDVCEDWKTKLQILKGRTQGTHIKISRINERPDGNIRDNSSIRKRV